MKKDTITYPVDMPFLQGKNICIWDTKGNYIHISEKKVQLVGQLFICISSNMNEGKTNLINQKFLFDNILELENERDYLRTRKLSVIVVIIAVSVLISTLILLRLK